LPVSAKMKTTDIRIEQVSSHFEDFGYRTPIKFGGVAVDRVTILNVDCVVHTVAGRTWRGSGSMTLGDVWAFPSRVLPYADTLKAMKPLTEWVARITAECRESGHPIDLTWTLEPNYHRAAEEVSRLLQLAEPIPRLATLVVAS